LTSAKLLLLRVELQRLADPAAQHSDSPLQLRVEQLPPSPTLTIIQRHLRQIAPGRLSPIPI